MPLFLSAPDADKLALSLFEGAGMFPGTPGGATWLARDTATGTSVAVRRLAANAAKARVTGALNLSHPNIVRTRRWFAAGGHLYAVRDVVRGRNLKAQLAGFDGRYGAELLEKLFLPVLSALEAAHGAGVVHGGVSAENVLISDDGRVFVADFAVVDSSSKHHAPVYAGAATVGGDIKAAGTLLTRYLPTGGAFASDAVRARVAGIIERCDSVGDLRETLAVLDKLASAPVPSRAGSPPIIAPVGNVPAWVGPPPLPDADAEGSTVPNETRTVTIDEPATNPENWAKTKPVAAPVEAPRPKPGAARLSYRVTETGGVRVVSGGGAPATLILTNDGDVTLTVRGIATQRPWLQVRPMELPVRLPGGASAPLDFAVSARSLSPGEYKSEIYLSADADGANAADLRGGWFKHTAELRVIVIANGVAAANEKPPYPANAPTIPAPPGCALLFVAGAGILTSGLAWGLRLLNL